MPFDPDELANGMMKWLEHGRKQKPTDAKPLPEDEYDLPYPEPGGYGAYDPGVIYQNPEPSPPPAEMPGSGPNIQELQEQIKALQEQLKALQGDGGAQLIPLGPGRDAPELTPEERLEKDWEMFDKWRQGSGGEPRHAGTVPLPDPNAPREKPRWENLPYLYKEEEKPNWENLPYRYKAEEKPNWENLPYKLPENPNDNPNIQLLKGLNK